MNISEYRRENNKNKIDFKGRLKAIIFDMDGVLIDSEPIYTYWVEEFLIKKGIDIDHNDLKQLPGSSREEFMSKLSKWSGLEDKEEIGVFLREYGQYLDKKEPVKFSDLLNPYVKFTLSKFKEMGLKLAIASSSSMEDIHRMVKECDLSEYFEYLISGRDLKESKPNPEIYYRALKDLNVRKDEALIIEDSNYGIQAAINAGVKVIAKRDVRFAFKQDRADDIADDMFEVYLKVKDFVK